MSESSFVHLRLHTEYSISDSIVKIPRVIEKAYQDRQPAIGITDLGNTFALMKFYRNARKKGIKPILGVDMWVRDDDYHTDKSRILLLCKSTKGYKKLCKLISRAWLKNSSKTHAEINFKWFEMKDESLGGKMSDDLICLSGGNFGHIGNLIQNTSLGEKKKINDLVVKYRNTFEDNFYLEVHRAGFPNEDIHIENIMDFASVHRIPIVATHPIQFLEKNDFDAHSARVCIAEGESPFSIPHF